MFYIIIIENGIKDTAQNHFALNVIIDKSLIFELGESNETTYMTKRRNGIIFIIHVCVCVPC